ncbi:MAG: hypothetical protein KA764_10685, partial [Anaerolineales bacterium]|nr:hypothetical protein [Anaerolineales bacterium]
MNRVLTVGLILALSAAGCAAPAPTPRAAPAATLPPRPTASATAAPTVTPPPTATAQPAPLDEI